MFEHDRREQHGLEAMGAAVPNDAAETPQRGAPAWLVVVGKPVEVPLDEERRSKARDQPPLAGQKAAISPAQAP
jgi:hypothetical protein